MCDIRLTRPRVYGIVSAMYYVFIAICFVVGPIVSIVIEHLVTRRHDSRPGITGLVLRWFTFWIVGVRLFLAGATQALFPQFTAEDIFDSSSPEVLPIVTELGFANLAFGAIGILSLFLANWVKPAALAGAIFLGLDGVRHVVAGGEFTVERTVAMATDLIALVVLAGGLIAVAVLTRRTTPETAG